MDLFDGQQDLSCCIPAFKTLEHSTGASSLVGVPPLVQETVYETDFEKVLLLRYFERQVVELQTKRITSEQGELCLTRRATALCPIATLHEAETRSWAVRGERQR